jgi:hypothetical protein
VPRQSAIACKPSGQSTGEIEESDFFKILPGSCNCFNRKELQGRRGDCRKFVAVTWHGACYLSHPLRRTGGPNSNARDVLRGGVGRSAMHRSLTTSSSAADRDLESRIESYLAMRHVPGLRQLEVLANNGIVTLRGQVRSFYEKQLSHHCCRRVAGVVQLIDAVDVVHTPQRATSTV